MKKQHRFALVVLLLCLFCLSACQQKEPVSSLSPSSESNGVSSSLAASLPPEVREESAGPSNPETSASAASASPNVAFSQSDAQGEALDGEGDFVLAGLELGTTLSQVEGALLLMGENAPQLQPVEGEDGVYGFGTETLCGREFARSLTFSQEGLERAVLTLRAREEEDLTALYQALKEELEAQYAWEQDVAVSNVMFPSGEEYDQQLYSRAPLAGGETALVLSACQEEGPSGMATLWIELQVERA